ncbi:MAG: stage II sporulation protein P, partial [Oscillospiraceae bacterium]
MPESSFKLLKNWINDDAPATAVETESTAQTGAKSDGFRISQSEDETAVSKTVSLSAVPKDIAALIAQKTESAKNDVEDGPIKETEYGKGSATSIFKNVLVKNNTSTKSINIEKVLNEKIDLTVDKSKPAVLLFHTHTTEAYEILDRGWYAQNYVTRSDNEALNMVRVGDEIEKQLVAAGYVVIHEKTIHDRQYSGAYDRSRAGILKILNENPSIKIVIDVHRDGIKQNDGTRIKPTTTVFNKKAAQVMIIAGCQGGLVKQFPTWEENLTFGLHLQEKVESLYSGTMRPILFCERKYNMDVTPCSLLLEFGSDSNTLEEVEYSGHLIGISLSKLIEDYV